MTVPDPDNKAIIRAPSREVSIARGNMASRALSMVSNTLANLQVITNSIGMKLALIKAGTFLMGSPEGDPGRDNEESQHLVTLSRDFYLGVFQVTQEQYERVMGSNPSRFVGPQNPVETVSWNHAMEFCKKLSALPEEQKAGRVYCLPTEAQWEYACRAGTSTKYGFGDDATELEKYAWYRDNSGQQTHPVGQKQPNAWGLYDMHGNVWEWCEDWVGKYPNGSVTDPVGPESGYDRVLRGGGWSYFAESCRSAVRDCFFPQSSGNGYGFRVTLRQPSELLGDVAELLTQEIAEQFLADEDSVDLDEFTAIEDAAAESLSKHEGWLLELNGLTSLSDAAAESLSKRKGRGVLELNGLTSLSDAAAESLSKHDRGLFLNGLTSLSDAAAESLSKHKRTLYLDGLTSLSDAAAESFSKHKNWLSLDGLTSLSDAAAESFSKHEGGLSLDGLTSLSDAAAESFSKHEGGLSLNGLTSLSDAAAESFSKHEGGLKLNGLTSLSDAAAESLSKHKAWLELNGLTSLSDAAAESLSKHEGELELNGLTSLSDAAAESFSKHQGELRLYGLRSRSLSDAAAESLSKHPSFADED